MAAMRRVSSRHNPIVARFRELARAPGGDGAMLLDGEHLVEEALAAGVMLETVAVAERVIDLLSDGIVARLEKSGARMIRVPEQVMAAMSPVRQPSGIVAIGRVPANTVKEVLERSPQLVVVAVGVQDAGNVGAIVRASEACGATGVITTDGTADPFGWKALRGAMGSTFRLPVAARQPIGATIDRLEQARVPLLAAVPRNGTTLPECDLTGPFALVLGAEGPGLPDAVTARATRRVTIPMRPPVESLNVAITAALILYEAARQRERRTTPTNTVR
jgi:RNA methyltransferase, TrmH family